MADSYVVTGALMTCTFGMAPSALVVDPSRTDFLSNLQKGNIMDFKPMMNIMPFGMCTAPSNPTVAAATAAAMGVLTPMPCIPAVTTPWMPGNMQVLVQGQPALMRTCCNMCMWGGQISFTTDGQMPCPPPIIIPPISVMMPDPLNEFEKALLTSDEQWQYNRDWEDAQRAGSGDRYVAEQLNEMAKRYFANGEYEKAQKAQIASQQYQNRANQKQAAAMKQVNDKFMSIGHGTPMGNAQPEAVAPEDLQGIYDQANKDHAQYENEVKQLDRQLADNEVVLDKKRDQLGVANQNLLIANSNLDKATQARIDATDKRETAEWEAQKAAWAEKSAKERGDKEAASFFHQQKKDAENTAKQAAKEEKKAKEKLENAEKVQKAASKEQDRVSHSFYETYDEWRDLIDQKQTAKDNRDAAEQKANMAKVALDAKETLDRHDEAVSKHQETVKNTREKREEKTAYEKEQQKYQDNADAWFKLGAEAQRQGNQELANSFYRNDGINHDKAVEAGNKVREKEKEYQQSKAEMKEAYHKAYNDDAMLDAYTAEINLDYVLNNLDKGNSGDRAKSAEDGTTVSFNSVNDPFK